MSNKVEAATGGTTPNTFTDDEGQIYQVHDVGSVLMLSGVASDGEIYDVAFYKADAAKIIALIAEAAK